MQVVFFNVYRLQILKSNHDSIINETNITKYFGTYLSSLSFFSILQSIFLSTPITDLQNLYFKIKKQSQCQYFSPSTTRAVVKWRVLLFNDSRTLSKVIDLSWLDGVPLGAYCFVSLYFPQLLFKLFLIIYRFRPVSLLVYG